MPFRIVVTELDAAPIGAQEKNAEIKRYEQTVDELDLRAVMDAVNKTKRGPRVAKKDAAK